MNFLFEQCRRCLFSCDSNLLLAGERRRGGGRGKGRLYNLMCEKRRKGRGGWGGT
jgi:hypothetical protein